MKQGSVFVYIVIVFLICVAFFAGVFFLVQRSNKPETFTNRMSALTLLSSAFSHNESIPSEYTCDGKDINPPLLISGVSEGARSLVLIMDDPDAPVGTWDHWVLWNINPGIKEIGENSTPPGAIEGKTSFGQNRYGGPCPPNGTHRYFFKLYALDTMLDLPSRARKKEVEKAMEDHVIEKAELIGLYRRK